MKKLIVWALATLAVAAAAGSVLIENASARGRTCTYVAANGTGIYLTVDGKDNGPRSCNLFGKPAFRRVSRAHGRMYCRFSMVARDVRVTIRAKKALRGIHLQRSGDAATSGRLVPRRVDPHPAIFGGGAARPGTASPGPCRRTWIAGCGALTCACGLSRASVQGWRG